MSTNFIAQVLFYPNIEFGGYNSNNYYATSSPNINVAAATYGISNTLSWYINPFLSNELYIGYDEESTNTIVDNNRSLTSTFTLSVSPLTRLSVDSTINYFHYRSDRYDSGNIDLYGGNETIYFYFDSTQFLSLSGLVNHYNYVKTNKKALKNKAVLAYQGPWDVYISYGLANLSSTDDISQYNEQSVYASKYFWELYPFICDFSAKYTSRDYDTSRSDYFDAKLRFSYYVTTSFKLQSSANYYSDLNTKGQENIQLQISLSYSETFDPSFKRSKDNRTKFMYADALYSIEKDDFSTASHRLDRVIFADPNHAQALFERALIFHEEENYDRAAPLFKRAIQSDQGMVEAYYLLAHNLIQLNRVDEAKVVLEVLYEQTENESILLYLNQL